MGRREVLPCYEFLLAHFERFSEHEKLETDVDLKLNIQLRSSKLNEYHKKLYHTEIYMANKALHPTYGLDKIKQMWADG